MKVSRANEWLSRLEQQIEHDLNPSRRCRIRLRGLWAALCAECRQHEINIRRAVRVEVLREMDIHLARAFLRRFYNWRGPDLEDAKVLANLHAGRAASTDLTTDERADSACWVEGLL